MKRYYAVEVTRTVTERRKIYVCAETKDEAKDAAWFTADPTAINTPWELPHTEYEVASAAEVDRPARVDVTV